MKLYCLEILFLITWTLSSVTRKADHVRVVRVNRFADSTPNIGRLQKDRRLDESTPHSTYGPLDFCSGHDEICRGISRRGTYDDRRSIYVRRREATGALLMHGADSFAAEAAADTYKCPQSRH